MSTKRVIRIDRGTLKAPQMTEDGFMRISGYAARVGVLDYGRPDGSVFKELRLPEDVFSKRSLDSYTGRPFTNDHPGVPVSPANATAYTKGAVLGARPEGDYVAFDAMVYDGATMADMKDGKRELSAGYRLAIEMRKKNDSAHDKLVKQWGPFDAIQRDILINHLALVDGGRAGPAACVQMDSFQMDGFELDFAIQIDRATIALPRKEDGDPAMMSAKERENLQASMFAVPASRQLPIPDENHVRAAMARFGETKFASTAEKRTAFNRIVARAKELKIDPSGFVKEWGGRLDHLDFTNKKDKTMPNPAKPELNNEDKTLVQQALKQYGDEKLRADNAERLAAEETKRADKAEGRIAELEQKLKDANDNRADDAALADKDAKIKTLTTERDAATAKVIELSKPELLEDAAKARANIIAKSYPIINADATKTPIDLHKMDDKEIMVMVVEKRRGENISERSDDYIASRWETTVEDFDNGTAALARLREASENPKATPPVRADARSARQKYLDDKKNGWKKPGQKEAE